MLFDIFIYSSESDAQHILQPNYLSAKKYVVFAIYGDRQIDLIGIIENALAVPLLYPTWKVLVYIDDTVPLHHVDQIINAGGEVIRVTKEQAEWKEARRIWRFLVLADPTVEFAIFRDADSRISDREISAVNTWLQSSKTFHLMHDHPHHHQYIILVRTMCSPIIIHALYLIVLLSGGNVGS